MFPENRKHDTVGKRRYNVKTTANTPECLNMGRVPPSFCPYLAQLGNCSEDLGEAKVVRLSGMAYA